MEQTFLMIKPDAVQQQNIGAILHHCHQHGFAILALRMLTLSPDQVRTLYHEHAGRSYVDRLITFSTSGPVVVCLLEGFRAVERLRHLVGATHPSQAGPDTLRRQFGTGVPNNAVHASDSPEAARREIDLFFTPDQIANPIRPAA